MDRLAKCGILLVGDENGTNKMDFNDSRYFGFFNYWLYDIAT